jgi:hypothetical protein
MLLAALGYFLQSIIAYFRALYKFGVDGQEIGQAYLKKTILGTSTASEKLEICKNKCSPVSL